MAKAQRTARAFARRAVAAEPLDKIGRWNGYFDLPEHLFAINAAMLPTGKVFWFSYTQSPDYGPGGPKHGGTAYVWDPAKGTGPSAFKAVPPPVDPARGLPVNLFCTGVSFLADGRVLVTGGNLAYPAETGDKYAGLKHVYTFDPYTETWTKQPDMNHGRWYPSQLLMPDGRTFIMGGLDEGGHANKNEDLELFTPSAARNGVGTIEFLGPKGVLDDPGMPPRGDYYPHLFWMPSGHGARRRAVYRTTPGSFDPPGNPAARSRTGTTSPIQLLRACGARPCSSPGAPAGSPEVLQLGGSDNPKRTAAADHSARGPRSGLRRARRPRAAGSRRRRCRSRARTSTPCCSPTARW